jgi:hypothetical protein
VRKTKSVEGGLAAHLLKLCVLDTAVYHFGPYFLELLL